MSRLGKELIGALKEAKKKGLVTLQALPDKIRVKLAQTHPTKVVLKRAIAKSIKKHKETLKILTKR